MGKNVKYDNYSLLSLFFYPSAHFGPADSVPPNFGQSRIGTPGEFLQFLRPAGTATKRSTVCFRCPNFTEKHHAKG